MNQGQRTLFRVVAYLTGGIALVLAGLSLTGRIALSVVVPLLLLVAAGGLLAASGRRIS